MTEIIAGIIALAAIALVGFNQWQTRQHLMSVYAAEDRRVADWWRRIQSDVDNLRDRVNSKEFETYAQASHVERPGDQPTFTAEGEYNAGGMASALLEQLREEQQSYGEDPFDSVAEDYVGPTVG